MVSEPILKHTPFDENLLIILVQKYPTTREL